MKFIYLFINLFEWMHELIQFLLFHLQGMKTNT